MARQLNGSSEYLSFSAGALAGAHAWGMVAALVKRDVTGGLNWHCPIYSGTGDSGTWGWSIDISTGNSLWIGCGTIDRTTSLTINSTSTWYILVGRKNTGSSAVVYSSYLFSTNTWTHVSGTAAADQSSPTVSQVLLGAFGGPADFFDGAIAAAMIIRNWVPADNTALENLGLQTNAQNWLTATQNAGAGAGLWVPGQTATNVAIQDLTGGGANETSSNVGSVVAGPTGWTETVSTGAIELEGTASLDFSATGDLEVAKELASTSSMDFSSSGALEVTKLIGGESFLDFSSNGDIQVEKTLDGTCTMDFGASGELYLEKLLEANVSMDFSSEGSMLREALLSGEISMDLSSTGFLQEPVNPLFGSSSMEFDASGELEITKELEGQADFSMTVRGRLYIGQKTPFIARLQVIEWGRNRWFDPQFEDIGV